MKKLSKSSQRRKRSPQALEQRMKKGIIKSSARVFKNVFKPDIEIPLYKDNGKGEHWIDIISYFAGKNDPITSKGLETHTCEYYYHRNIGPNDDPYLCRIEMGLKGCPVCEDRNILRKAGEDDDIWKQLFPKTRNLYNIVVRDGGKEEKKGVQVYDISYHYMEKYLQALAKKPVRPGRTKIDPFIPFAHPELGKTIYYKIEPAKGKEDFANYLGHNFEDRDYTISKKILNSLFVLDELLYIPTYDEVYEAYWFDKDNKEKRKEKHGRGGKGEIEDIDKLEEKLEMMDIDELEDYIDEEELFIETEGMDEDDIIEAIIDYYSQTKEGFNGKKDGEVCPVPDGVFGESTNTLDECDECEIWDGCMEGLKKSKRG